MLGQTCPAEERPEKLFFSNLASFSFPDKARECICQLGNGQSVMPCRTSCVMNAEALGRHRQ